ncbi:MAG: translation initiation factor IF-3 [Candidatus Manganitrophus sp.]|nr:translation initiation factor IF-3 [Candidatus Manganitrophus sp.]MDC4223121.1 translation initiation factor IF-3 [Candidatus Manganitrophus sp.]WDT73322.1 MAG: translation initiation factor IF-3 [Candidatus Manganitrophus sp.]WDT77686.1 MAG: translation initiation factor IF-3 [Candidatus Manganitrophus sp.]WDT82602.1 MAG: translation initiation factor IF-3 [Candidatus Manganitrophus sp.]
MNLEIRAREVRVIGPEGEQLGIMSSRDATKKAEEYGLDLVEVAPTSAPPVCRIMDFGKYKYEQSKKEHAAKLNQKGTHVKEVKFRLFTGEHDLDFKIKHARDFLSSGNKVKTTLMFRGREMAYQQKGREIMAQILQQLQDVGAPENPPRMEGNSMVMLLIPKLTKESK